MTFFFPFFSLMQVWAVCWLRSQRSNVFCLSAKEVYWLYWNDFPGFHLSLRSCNLRLPVAMLLFYSTFFSLLLLNLISNRPFVLEIRFVLLLFCRTFWLGNFLVSQVNCQLSMIGRIIWQQYFPRFVHASLIKFLNFQVCQILSLNLCCILLSLFRSGWRDTWRWGELMEDLGGGYVLCLHFG